MEWIKGAFLEPGEEAPPEEESDPIDNQCFVYEQDTVIHGYQEYICGQLPCPRAGMTVIASTVTLDGASDDGCEYIMFGGGQYVRKHWYRDLYELSFKRVVFDDGYASASDMEDWAQRAGLVTNGP